MYNAHSTLIFVALYFFEIKYEHLNYDFHIDILYNNILGFKYTI